MNQVYASALVGEHNATFELSDELLQDAIDNHDFKCTVLLDDIKGCNVYIVTIPTPVN